MAPDVIGGLVPMRRVRQLCHYFPSSLAVLPILEPPDTERESL